jgi:hypothetical protein
MSGQNNQKQGFVNKPDKQGWNQVVSVLSRRDFGAATVQRGRFSNPVWPFPLALPAPYT